LRRLIQNSAATVVPGVMARVMATVMTRASQGMHRPRGSLVPVRRRHCAWRSIGGCRKAAAAVEFALVSGPFLLMLFGFVATNSLFYTWSVMQNNVQYAAMMMATGQVTSWSSSGVSCGSTLATTQVEYYACSGLPPWTTFTAKAAETCSVPNVSVTLTTNASNAGLADIYSLFSGVTLTAAATAMKQGSCP
jgi:Flp pilus assembly protein TadG